MTPDDLRRRLACLLWAYENWGEGSPAISPEEFAANLAEPHGGDCVKLPAPCIRCWAEEADRKARWLAERLGEEGRP